MILRWGTAHKSVALLLLLALAGCQAAQSAPLRPLVWQTVPPELRVPINVERLAVLYPKTYNRLAMDAYARLAGTTFRFKEQRPSLRILERFDLSAIQHEQRFQLSGSVSDESALRVGHLLGVDSVLLYRIEEPSVRDRALAKHFGDLPPFTVTSKIIMVESGEVVYHNVVTAPIARAHLQVPHFFSDPEMDHQLRAALDRGVNQTITDLRWAFRSTD